MNVKKILYYITFILIIIMTNIIDLISLLYTNVKLEDKIFQLIIYTIIYTLFLMIYIKQYKIEYKKHKSVLLFFIIILLFRLVLVGNNLVRLEAFLIITLF